MRQLAAILFADMSGYTALMQENEQLARAKRKRLKEVLEDNIARFNGKVLQYYGDGSLSIFNSAIDSVRSAVSIQQQLQEAPTVELRIGIHTGDIVIEEDAIFGDGVNMASRIESMAVPGGIFISGKVYDEIKNQQDIQARELGYFELKNIKDPVQIFAIANEGIVVPARHSIRGKTKTIANRLAVLPFVNMSADPENEYFSDGITEELLNALTRVEGLQVTSRTSSFAFKNKNHDIRDIAIQLNVDKVLEGSVRKAGNRVRITAQLINAADGYHIWSENYDRHLTDIFEVQDEISNIIANKLRENLSIVPRQQGPAKSSPKNIKAYTYYLKGLHYWNKQTPADGRKALQCFEDALTIEPAYAQAFAMAAACYSYLGATGQMLPHTAFKQVHQYADKAIELDSSVAEGHISKASALLFYDWKWQEAHDALQKAIALNAAATEAYELLSFYYVTMGRTNDAVQVMEKAHEIDPLSPIVLQSLANAYVFAERYSEAIQVSDQILEINPQRRITMELKAWAIGMGGNWEKALPYFEEVHRLTNHPLKGLMGLGYAYTQLGRKEEALEVIRKMELRQQQEPDSVIDADIAAIWWGLGDTNKTFYHLFQCVEKKMGPPAYFLEYPAYRGVKKDPRYNELRRKMNIA
jgi:TolB-like protein/Flp pilus assembly protein TadD